MTKRQFHLLELFNMNPLLTFKKLGNLMGTNSANLITKCKNYLIKNGYIENNKNGRGVTVLPKGKIDYYKLDGDEFIPISELDFKFRFNSQVINGT